jgi:hypothetical protein
LPKVSTFFWLLHVSKFFNGHSIVAQLAEEPSIRVQCYKTVYFYNLPIFVISLSICP